MFDFNVSGMLGARRDEDPTSDCDHRETVPVRVSGGLCECL